MRVDGAGTSQMVEKQANFALDYSASNSSFQPQHELYGAKGKFESAVNLG